MRDRLPVWPGDGAGGVAQDVELSVGVAAEAQQQHGDGGLAADPDDCDGVSGSGLPLTYHSRAAAPKVSAFRAKSPKT